MKNTILHTALVLAVLANDSIWRRAEIHLPRNGQDDGQVLL